MNEILKILLKAEVDSSSTIGIQKQIEEIQKKSKPIKIKIDVDGGNTLKSTQAIQDVIGKTIQMREKENRLLEERQSKAINKDLDSQYKQQLANIQKSHVEALKMNRVYDEQAAKLATLKGTFEQLKGEQQNANNIAKILQSTYGGLEVAGSSLNRINGQYSVTLKQSAQENLTLKGTIDQVTGALHVQSEQVRQTGNVQLGFWGQMKDAMTKLPAIFSATAIYYQASKFVKGTVTEIKDLNKEMIDLEKVSSASNQELDAFFRSAPQKAKDLGVLTSEVISTTAEISKLGYSLSEAQFLTELSNVGAIVGDLDNVGDSVDYLTSILKGFRMETSQGTGVLDFLNHTANTTSINFAALGEGFKRMSASMSEGNNTLEETTGLLVAGYDVVRNSEMVSTA